MLSSNVIFAKRCSRILYSSNRDDYIAPFAIRFDSGATGDISFHAAAGSVAAGVTRAPPIERLAVPAKTDLLARSLSADCKTAALVGDRGGTGVYSVYLYDFATRLLTDLTASSGRNEGEAEFAPVGTSLAYLGDGALRLYDAASRHAVMVPRSPAEFRSLAWSSDGGRIFLEDRATDIWQFDVTRSSFRRLWAAPREAYSPRMMVYARDMLGEGVYFVSDHESDVTQVYRLDLATLATSRIYPSTYDQYSPQLDPGGHLVFRSNIDGNYVAYRLRNGKAEAISPSHGVAYDLSLDFGSPLFAYASDRSILSIYAADHGDTARLGSLVPIDFPVSQPAARELRGADGMVHFVYEPSATPKGWIVWLHGGPNEQVSPRFNLYFDFLVRSGYGVVAINYPGSTGIGNRYELRGVPDAAAIRVQLAGIDDVLARLAAQYPTFSRYAVVGVSYGSTLGYLHIREHPDRVTGFIDFFGGDGRPSASSACRRLRRRSIVAADPRAERSASALAGAPRAALGLRPEATARRVVLADEGHFIRHRSSVRRILGEIERFLATPMPDR